jgi:hypothetical protein
VSEDVCAGCGMALVRGHCRPCEDAADAEDREQERGWQRWAEEEVASGRCPGAPGTGWHGPFDRDGRCMGCSVLVGDPAPERDEGEDDRCADEGGP